MWGSSSDNSVGAVSSGCTLFAILVDFYFSDTLFAAVDVPKVKDGRAHFRNSGVKGLML